MCVTFPLCVNVAVAPCCLGDACGTTICLLHEATRCTTMYSSCPSRLSPEPSGTPLVTPHTPHAPHPLSLSLAQPHIRKSASTHVALSHTPSSSTMPCFVLAMESLGVAPLPLRLVVTRAYRRYIFTNPRQAGVARSALPPKTLSKTCSSFVTSLVTT